MNCVEKCTAKHDSGLLCDGDHRSIHEHSAFLPGLPVCTIVSWKTPSDDRLVIGGGLFVDWKDGLWQCAGCRGRNVRAQYAATPCISEEHTARRMPQIKCLDCAGITLFCTCSGCSK